MDNSKSLLQLHSRYSPRWTDNQIRRFIETRIKYESLFDERLYSTQEVWETIAIEARIPEHWRKLRKKWSNLKYTYKKIYHRSKQTGQPPNTWAFFEILDRYENDIQSKTRNRDSPTCKIGESNDESNSDDYSMETLDYVIEDPSKEIRTYHRASSSQNTKSTEPNKPLLRIDQSIFKPKELDIAPDPDSATLVVKIEDESETEVYEIIPSPKQDYPSDPVEYETSDETNNGISSHQLSQQPHILNDEEVCPTANPPENEIPEKSSNKSKKRISSKFDDETRSEKKLRQEILKCTNVFLKYMKMKYDIDPDPISSESDSE